MHELFLSLSGGQFEPELSGQFKLVFGGQFHRFLHYFATFSFLCFIIRNCIFIKIIFCQMKSIHKITKENFGSMFNIKDILSDSVYYPASGIDAKDIELLSENFCSFIHTDYSIPKDIVKAAMSSHFEHIGYDLIGIKNISKAELIPKGKQTQYSPIKDFEKERLSNISISDKFYGNNLKFYALWSVYELNPQKTNITKRKAKRFSLLHIGGEACSIFDATYINNKINPSSVVIINPGGGYGDNWTKFENPDFRFYQNIKFNAENNKAKMPSFILTNNTISVNNDVFWPDYLFDRSLYGHYNLYKKKENMRKNNINKKQNKNLCSIELLNFEGPVLSATKFKKLYIIQDQWKNIVDILSEDEIKLFIDGEKTISDSQGKAWNYKKEHKDAKPTIEEMTYFLSN